MTDYALLTAQLSALAADEPHWLPVLSNAAALLWESLENINWAGFYLTQGESLLLGPFQGKVACIRIPYGRGVCGTAAAEDKTQLVPDVHAFPGHIACDSASRSEIVVPLHCGSAVIGVLDIDSPTEGRFTEQDRQGLETFARTLEEVTHWQAL